MNKFSNTDTRKILFVLETFESGGKERRACELIKWFTRNTNYSIELLLIRSDKIHFSEIFDLKIKVHTILSKRKYDFTLMRKIYKLCNLNKYDLIHSWGLDSTLHIIPAAKLLNIKLINSLITNTPKKLGKRVWLLTKIIFFFSNKISALSQAGIKAYSPPPKKTVCNYAGFDFDRILNIEDNQIIRNRFAVKTKFVVGMVASFTTKKDYPTFVNAAKEILKKRQDITFLCIGEGPKINIIKNLASDCKENIIFTGVQSNVENIINIFDIGVLTSFTEGFSNAVMEYMAMGKPVVASSEGGIEELIVSNQTGYLLDIGNVEEIAKKIEYLIDNKDTALSMGEKGKQRIMESFSIEKMCEGFYEIYRELILDNNFAN